MLYSEEAYTLYSSTNIIRLIKQKKNFSFYTSYFFNKITEVQSPEGKDQQILQIMTQ